MNSFFGGDPTLAYFRADVRYRLDGENSRASANRRKSQREELKAAGIKPRHHQFRNGDEAGKATAKAAAEREAQLVKDRIGLELEVCEGCFL